MIPDPVRAKTVIPDWFRKLPAQDENHVSTSDNGLTIKRCMSFLDAMMAGWVIGLAVTIRLDISENGRRVDVGWEFDRAMVSHHGTHQVARKSAHPAAVLQVSQFLDDPHAAGLELPVRGAAQLPERRLRDRFRHC